MTDKRPFWSYVDLLMFVGILLPSVGASLIAGALLTPFVGLAPATWIAQFVLYALLLGWLALLLRVRYDRPFWESLAWVYPRRSLAVCIAAGPMLAITVGILGQVLNTPIVDIPMKKLLQGKLSLALFGVFSVIIGPVIEELVFRGFMMPLLVRTWGAAMGIILTAIPFGLLHGSQYGWHWQYVFLVGLAGAGFGVARHFTGSTLASTAMHGTYNLTIYVALVNGLGK